MCSNHTGVDDFFLVFLVLVWRSVEECGGVWRSVEECGMVGAGCGVRDGFGCESLSWGD